MMAEQEAKTGKVPTFGQPDDPRAWVKAANFIAECIGNGTYKPGKQIILTDVLGQMNIPVNGSAYHAFKELADAGFLEKRRSHTPGGAAYFVADDPPEFAAAGTRAPLPDVERVPSEERPYGGKKRAPLKLSKEPDNYLTVSEVARRLRVSNMTVYRLVREGRLEAIQVGRSYRVPERGLHEYLRRAQGN